MNRADQIADLFSSLNAWDPVSKEAALGWLKNFDLLLNLTNSKDAEKSENGMPRFPVLSEKAKDIRFTFGIQKEEVDAESTEVSTTDGSGSG